MASAISKFLDLFGSHNGSSKQQNKEQGTSSQRHVTPNHVAIIMDGNGRWATRRHLPRSFGHKAGVEAVRRVVECATDEHVPMLSIYAFSTENWDRPQDEVSGLMRLFWEVIQSDVDRLNRNGVRLRHIGRLEGLSPDLQEAIQHSVEITKQNTKLAFNVCFNYGGRAELVDAVRHIVADGLSPELITEEVISRYLYTKDLPDPDLVIRTASEMRLSNFLIWQAAYSEYYATETLWPDFTREDFLDALNAYSQRQRRFGKVMPAEEQEPVTLGQSRASAR
jgi:undecaprenyl diphosphate synthase